MTLEDKLERELEELGNTIRPNEKLIDVVMSRIEEHDSAKQHGPVLLIRRKIMNRFTKFAAAAVIVIAVVLWAKLPGSVISTAYALQDTIEAYNSICFLHIKKSSPKKSNNFFISSMEIYFVSTVMKVSNSAPHHEWLDSRKH